jgi:hypothetical protein
MDTDNSSISVKGVWVRGILYVTAAAITATHLPFQSPNEVLQVVLAVIVATRAYLDKSPTQMRDEKWYQDMSDEILEAARRNRRTNDNPFTPPAPLTPLEKTQRTEPKPQ